MPALIAYLLSVGIFFGGGYLGLNFLAGNFEATPQTSRVDAGQKTDGKHKGNGPQLRANSVSVPQAWRDEASVPAGASGEEAVAQSTGDPSLSHSEQSTIPDSPSQAPQITHES